MHITFYHSTKAWCGEFAELFGRGIVKNGDSFSTRGLDDPVDNKADVICLLGAGNFDTFARVRNCGKLVCYLDKGWSRAKDFTPEGAYFHISIGDYRPSHYVGKWQKPDDRRDVFGWEPARWRLKGEHILLAWSSVKYHQFHGLPPPHIHAADIVTHIRAHSDRPIVWRQKPNQDKVEVPGTIMSPEGKPLEQDLVNCHCLVTVGSSACLQALLMGVPSIVLHDALTSPISSSTIEHINYPYLATEMQKRELLNDLAYCQWHQNEFASGKAWSSVRPMVVQQLTKLTEKSA